MTIDILKSQPVYTKLPIETEMALYYSTIVMARVIRKMAVILIKFLPIRSIYVKYHEIKQ
jgi:hypothetical protein